MKETREPKEKQEHQDALVTMDYQVYKFSNFYLMNPFIYIFNEKTNQYIQV